MDKYWVHVLFQEYYDLAALDILMQYLTDTSAAPLQKELVEIEDPYCSDVRLIKKFIDKCLLKKISKNCQKSRNRVMYTFGSVMFQCICCCGGNFIFFCGGAIGLLGRKNRIKSFLRFFSFVLRIYRQLLRSSK